MPLSLAQVAAIAAEPAFRLSGKTARTDPAPMSTSSDQPEPTTTDQQVVDPATAMTETAGAGR
jgi:hypothetical protein